MSKVELDYAGGTSFCVDFSELARPEALNKIITFVGAERGWIGLLAGEDRAIERIVTSTMMPHRGNMSALMGISKLILSTYIGQEVDGWHFCDLCPTSPYEEPHMAPGRIAVEDSRLYAISEFTFDARYKLAYFFQFNRQAPPSNDLTRYKLRLIKSELSQSINISARIAQKSSSIAVNMFDYLGIAAAIAMGSGLEVAQSNQAFRPYLLETERLRSEQARRARPGEAGRDGRIVAALTRLSASLRESAANIAPHHLVPIPAQGEQPPLLMHVIRDEDGLISGHLAVPIFLVLVTHVVRPAVPKEDVLQKLFAMTAAEARVAHNIAAGDKLEEIAAKTGVTVGTVRFHLKGVFAKTGLVRQADLVGLLSGLSVLRRSK